MIFDSLILAAVADELARTVVGAKVERVTQPAPLLLVLTLYQPGSRLNLLLSAEPEHARVHLTAQRRENPLHPPAFCMLLRKHLEGAWITEVRLPRGFAERVVHFDFQAHDGVRHTLIAETMGRLSNVVLVNADGTVLGAVKIVTRAINRVREVRPGLPYAPPPPQRRKQDPLGHFDAAAAAPPAADHEAEWLTETFSGVSPLLAREAVLRSHSPLTPESLWFGLNEILTMARLGEWSPRTWDDGAGRTLGAYPIPLLSVPVSDQHPRDSISVALDHASASQERVDVLAHARDSLQAALHRTRKARERERAEVEKGLENAERATEYQQAAELLLAAPLLVAAGAAQAVVPDYYAPLAANGSPPLRAIPLDPTLDARTNAERYFKRARKARDSRETLLRRREAIDAEAALLLRAEADARDAKTTEQIAAIRESVAASLVPTQQPNDAGKPGRNAPAFEGHKIKTYRSPDGWEILVGENAEANDYLTTRVAGPSDIWLHVRAATSAHGIIRTGNRPAAVSVAAIQQAAELVAARSDSKHSSLIPVDYTLKKYVHKPRKSRPGAALYQNEKTLYVSGIG